MKIAAQDIYWGGYVFKLKCYIMKKKSAQNFIMSKIVFLSHSIIFGLSLLLQSIKIKHDEEFGVN